MRAKMLFPFDSSQNAENIAYLFLKKFGVIEKITVSKNKTPDLRLLSKSCSKEIVIEVKSIKYKDTRDTNFTSQNNIRSHIKSARKQLKTYKESVRVIMFISSEPMVTSTTFKIALFGNPQVVFKLHGNPQVESTASNYNYSGFKSGNENRNAFKDDLIDYVLALDKDKLWVFANWTSHGSSLDINDIFKNSISYHLEYTKTIDKHTLHTKIDHEY